MSEMIAALEAAIAETERIALATESLEWIARLEHGDADVAEKDSGYLVAAYREVYPECAISLDDDVAVHIAHNDPKRVLRRVARDRKLLERHKPERRRIGEEDDEGWTDRSWYVCTWCTPNQRIYIGQRDLIEWPCDDVRDLAEDYEMEVES